MKRGVPKRIHSDNVEGGGALEHEVEALLDRRDADVRAPRDAERLLGGDPSVEGGCELGIWYKRPDLPVREDSDPSATVDQTVAVDEGAGALVGWEVEHKPRSRVKEADVIRQILGVVEDNASLSHQCCHPVRRASAGRASDGGGAATRPGGAAASGDGSASDSTRGAAGKGIGADAIREPANGSHDVRVELRLSEGEALDLDVEVYERVSTVRRCRRAQTYRGCAAGRGSS
jgi:hypothetical protein